MNFKNKIPLTILFLLLLPCNLFAFDIQYNLSISNPSSGVGNVQIVVRNFNQDILEIGSFATYELHEIGVSNITAAASGGQSLPVTSKPADKSFLPNNTQIWQIQSLGSDQITINYNFQSYKGAVDWRQDLIYFTYIADQLAVFLAEWVLLVPGVNYQIDSFTVSFQMPANWKVLCGWPKKGDTYYPSDLYHFGNWSLYNLIGSTTLSFGYLSTYVQQIDSAEFTVAIIETADTSKKIDMAGRLANLFKYYTNIFKPSIGYPFKFTILPNAGDGSWILEGAGPLTRHVSVYDFYAFYQNGFSAWYANCYELIEVRWLAGEWGIMPHGDPTLWMKRGISHAYAYKAMLNIGEIDSITVINELKKDYTLYSNCVEQGCDGLLANATWGGHTEFELARHKGGLVILLLANEIQKRTRGTKTFNELLSILSSKYRFSGKFLTTQLFEAEIEEYTKTDFTEFFNMYVFGTTALLYNEFFGDNDGDALTNAIEILTETDPNKSDTDSDGILDAIEDANRNGIVDAGETNPRKEDTDGDAMPDGWEVQYGLNPLVKDASGDKDGDGFSNLQEYKAGTNPTDPVSKPRPAFPWLPLLLDD